MNHFSEVLLLSITHLLLHTYNFSTYISSRYYLLLPLLHDSTVTATLVILSLQNVYIYIMLTQVIQTDTDNWFKNPDNYRRILLQIFIGHKSDKYIYIHPILTRYFHKIFQNTCFFKNIITMTIFNTQEAKFSTNGLFLTIVE